MNVIGEEGFSIHGFRVEASDRNYNYLVACERTGECVVVDPLDPVTLLRTIRERDYRVKYVVNTHAHPDHIEGNNPIIKVFLSSKILVHRSALDRVAPRSEAMEDGDRVPFGRQELRVVHTPGHCPEHVSLVVGGNVFVGDTVFVSGCGNVKFRGDVDQLYETFAFRLPSLSDELRMFCGHDYAETNLKFALSLDPGNSAAAEKLAQTREERFPRSTLGEERAYNPFMRTSDPAVVSAVAKRRPSAGDDPRAVFAGLRELRNNW